MSSKREAKPRRLGSKVANSPSSSTTSSSKHFLETSVDGQSSPASSSARSKPQYYYTENVSSKENVTVTVRFRPLRYTSFLSFTFFVDYRYYYSCLEFTVLD